MIFPTLASGSTRRYFSHKQVFEGFLMQLGNMRAVDVVWMLWMCLGMSHSQRGVCVGASVVHDVSGASLRPDVSSASLSLLVYACPSLSLCYV